ncbi:MAG TPA: thioredoxin-dependent thiol peroxidase [Bacilli bacterium]|nr:thioredoxin-dependent thiol peroxidase [Bacilli bacterium]
MLQVGQKVNNFTLPDQSNKLHSLSDYLGKKVVIYFYPKDNTPGCTKQACLFRDTYLEFKRLGVEVIGISKDSSKSHQKFVDDFGLPFILLSDEEKVVIDQFGVWQEKMMYGKVTHGVARTTFVLDESHNVVKVYEKANPDTNALDILEFLKA